MLQKHIFYCKTVSVSNCVNITDPLSEKRSSSVYVPKDETFVEMKQLTFSIKALKYVLHALVPTLEMTLINPDLGFPYFTAIDSLFNEGVTLPK